MTPSLRRPLTHHAAALLAALLVFAPVIASAQTAIPNPLRGQPAQKVQEKTETAPDAKPAPRSRAAAKAEGETKSDAKPKRERSAKQKENDEIMRACGASWRADKESLQAKGQTWRAYLKDCRAKRKGEQRA